jgi:hypothetical protein
MTNDASHPGRPEPRRGRHRRRAGPLAAALIGAGLLAAACGGPAGPGVANACAAGRPRDASQTLTELRKHLQLLIEQRVALLSR